MSGFKSDFLRTLDERGFVHQISDPEGLDAACLKGPITAYIGFDATATSLHAGSLIQIMMLYWMQQTGHRPISLMGGGTTHDRRPVLQGRGAQAALPKRTSPRTSRASARSSPTISTMAPARPMRS